MELSLSLLSSWFLPLFIFSFIQLHESIETDDKPYDDCKKRFQCGSVDNITYPFYDDNIHPAYCGYPGFKLNCSDDAEMPKISMTSTESYYLLSMDPNSHTAAVARDDYWDSFCLPTSDISLNSTLFSFTSGDENITLYYNCPQRGTLTMYLFPCSGGIHGIHSIGYFNTSISEPNFDGFDPSTECATNVTVPVYRSDAASIVNESSISAALRRGFEVEWLAESGLCDGCRESNGECGYNITTQKFACHCPDGAYDFKCGGSAHDKGTLIIRIAIIVSFSAIGIGLLVISVCCFKRKCSSIKQIFEDYQAGAKQDVEVFLKNYGSPGPKRYTYTDLKRTTKSFKDKLGEGGYGTVYKGNLQNEQLVAVKILKKLKGSDVREFINEVASIGMTNHVNIVKLLGFCYDGHKRALVYEFMPNGSLDKFVYGRKNNQRLAWEKLFQIAIGIARGLEYLHRGCNTRILHFDIKPHNILLDENFSPKISDFGLAKSCPQKDSIISMSEARGTVGYIAPEVFLRSFGGVSNKSDVYSYGMLVLEMVGCRKKADVESGSNSEQYFPQWIYKQLETGEESDDQDNLSREERELQRKMILVSLWCVQTNPSSRPAMSRVVEMLEGTPEVLQIPPSISLSSSMRSQPNGSTSTTVSM